MRRLKLVPAVSLGLSLAVNAAFGAELSYAEAEIIWYESKAKPEYQRYQAEFIQYSNYFHLDSQNSCYQISNVRVHLFVIISTKGVVEEVISEIGGDKAACFRQTYLGLRVKEPPFAPFVISVNME